MTITRTEQLQDSIKAHLANIRRAQKVGDKESISASNKAIRNIKKDLERERARVRARAEKSNA